MSDDGTYAQLGERDEEAGYCESDYDDDSDYGYDEEEETGQDEGGGDGETAEKKTRKRRKLGEWKRELAEQTSDVIPEDKLHEVPWGQVVLSGGINAISVLVFVGFMAFTSLPVPLALPIYLITFVSAVVVFETLFCYSLGAQIFVMVVFVIVLVAGVVVYGVLEFIVLACCWAFVPLLVMILVFKILEDPKKPNLHSTSSWQALSGTTYGIIDTRLGFVCLLKALKYNELESTSMFSRCMRQIYRPSTAMIGMTEVDETNPDVPDTPVVLNDREVEPLQWSLASMVSFSKDGTPEEMSLNDMEGLLKMRKVIGDPMVDYWLTKTDKARQSEAAALTEAQAAKVPRREKLRNWTVKVDFPPTGRSIVVVTLRRLSYWSGLSKHWVINACKIDVIVTLVAYPTVALAMQIFNEYQNICVTQGAGRGDDSSTHYFGDVVFCGSSEQNAKSCAEACSTMLKFFDVVCSRFQIAQVELTLLVVFIPVLIFIHSVSYVQESHNKEERTYLRRLRAPKKAIYEVMTLKASLENIFSLGTIFDRFFVSLQAWFGADPALKACGPITNTEFDLTSQKGYNDCLKRVMEPISAIDGSIYADKSEDLSFGVGYDQADGDGKEEVVSQWQLLKFRNCLGDASGRNYKILFDLKILNEQSWKHFEEWCQKDYKEQFDYITKASDAAQDRGTMCHLKTNALIHDIVIPRGFSLTHVYVQAMPEDGRPVQIELRGNQSGSKDFWKDCETIRQSIAKAAVDDEDEDAGDRLMSYPMIARFALSEQYFNSMSNEDKNALCDGVAPADFTEFVDILLTPYPFEYPTSGDGLYFTAISVFMGDESPLAALLAAGKEVVKALTVYGRSIGLALLVPVIRWCSGYSMFPAPLSFWLCLNTVGIFFSLAVFFQDFDATHTRLSIISECLGLLESESMASAKPASAQSAKAESKEGENSKQAAESVRAALHAQTDSRPFDLVVEDFSLKKDYDPSDEEWVKEWRKKHDNLRNWHATASSLRVFVSTSRLVAQTILVAAVGIVGLLLLASVLEATGGKVPTAMTDMISKKTGISIASASDDGEQTARRLHREIEGAMFALTVDHLANTSDNATRTDVRLDDREPIINALRGLHGSLSKARASFHQPLLLQHEALTDGHMQHRALQKWGIAPVAPIYARRMAEFWTRRYERRLADDNQSAEDDGSKAVAQLLAAEAQAAHFAAMLDVHAVTKTQIFTVAMLVLVMLYSIPLMWNIVQVNGFFDRHEDVLIKQRELHRVYQARREVKRKSTKQATTANGEGGNAGDEAGGDATDCGGGTEGEGAADAGAEAPTGTADVAGAGSTRQVGEPDPEAARYERMLDMMVEGARKSRERFPLKLFGFVISAQMLATWVFLASSPMVQQAKQMAPGLVMAGCTWVEHSKWVQRIQETLDDTASVHFDVAATFHENVCVPLSDLAVSATEKLAPEDGGAGQRRLLSKSRAMRSTTESLQTKDAEWPMTFPLSVDVEVPDLSAMVRQWWRSHPECSADAKFASASAMLVELGRHGDRLLVSAPRSVARAFQSVGLRPDRGEAAFFTSMGALHSHLDVVKAELEEVNAVEKYADVHRTHSAAISYLLGAARTEAMPAETMSTKTATSKTTISQQMEI
eukprot:TRINITY_DN1355_c0_g1_i2.p1 TRINITY_DN1355_c0_g1~~TRINITY_DN1355_c0_g1_i2.p1  ORF type:complete len:1644 (+),score=303.38 TRINITY_DN1355_c0_g1_i2:66-4934(+)